MLAIVAPAQPAWAGESSKAKTEPLEKLWEQYPLNPQAGRGSPPPASGPTTTPTAPPPAARSPGVLTHAPESSGSNGWIWIAGLAMLMLAATAAFVWFESPAERRRRLTQTLAIAGRRRALAHSESGSDMEGGTSMGRFIRRDREGSHEESPENVQEGKEHGELDLASADTAPPVDRFLPYSLRKGTEVTPAPPEERPAPRPRAESAPDYGHVGQRVADVLASAEHAAEQIRQQAVGEAESILTEARTDAARIRREAEEAAADSQRVRAEADAYSRDARGAADTYADEKRREGEEAATAIRERAEGDADGVIDAAEQRARELEKAAQRRGEELAREAGEAEERMQDLLTFSRELTNRLEGRLTSDAEGATPADGKSLDAALKARSAGAAQS